MVFKLWYGVSCKRCVGRGTKMQLPAAVPRNIRLGLEKDDDNLAVDTHWVSHVQKINWKSAARGLYKEWGGGRGRGQGRVGTSCCTKRAPFDSTAVRRGNQEWYHWLPRVDGLITFIACALLTLGTLAHSLDVVYDSMVFFSSTVPFRSIRLSRVTRPCGRANIGGLSCVTPGLGNCDLM